MELTRTSHHLQNLQGNGTGRSPASSPLTSGMLDLSKMYHQNPFFSNVHNSVFSEMSPFSIQAMNMNSRLGLLPPNFFSATTGPTNMIHANMNGSKKRNYSVNNNHDESFEASDNFYGSVDVPSPKKRKRNDDSGMTSTGDDYNDNEDEGQQLGKNYPPHPLDSSGSEASNGDGDSTSRRNSNKQPIPDDLKDVKYFERRRRNNLAAKKSRDARKTREDQLALRVAQLEKENAIFRAQVALLREEMGVLHLYLLQKNNGSFIPPKHSPPSSPPPASSLPSPTTSIDLHLPTNLSMSPQQEHSPRSKV